jgi:hypothetical protein
MIMSSGTPRIQCHGRSEAEKLEEILNRIKNGAKFDGVVRTGSIVYVHLDGQ